MLSIGRETINKIYHNGKRVVEVWYNDNLLFGSRGYVPDPIYPNDPHLDGIRIKLSINEDDPEQRRIYFTGDYTGCTLERIYFGDGTTSTEFPEYHQYENGNYELVIHGDFPSLIGGEIEVGQMFIESQFVSSNKIVYGEDYYYYDNHIIRQLYIGDDVGCTQIDFGAFAYYVNLDKIRLPATLERIGTDSFLKSGLSVADLRNCVNLKFVGDWAFDEMENLEKVILPENLNYIYNTFNFCENLKTVVFLHPGHVYYQTKTQEGPTFKIWVTCFGMCSSELALYVLPGYTDDYDNEQSVFPVFRDIQETNRGILQW